MNPTEGGGARGPLGIMFTPWVKRIMIATATLSIVSAIAVMWVGSKVPIHLGLNPAGVWGRGELAPIPAVWQIITYPFVELHVFVLLITLLMYGWFGATLEAWWGSVRFFKYFFGLIVWVGVVTVVLALFWPNLAAQTFQGSLPIIKSMIIAYALTFPDREIRLFFVLPVKGVHLAWISAGILVLLIVFSGAVAPFVPHIVGMTTTALLVTGAWRGKRLSLYLQKWKIQAQIKREQEGRKRRVGKASHLRVVDEDDSSGEDDPGSGGDGGGKGNGAGKNGAGGGGGWLH